MSRIARTISTIALVVATAGLIAPAAQAEADGLYPHVVATTSSQPGTGNLENDVFVVPTARGDRGAWLEHRALANPVDTQTTAVTGRAISTDGGIDWTFNREPLRTMADFMGSTPGGDYPAYAEAQTRELIERYAPSILWNDISWPTPLDEELRLFADYYNATPEGVVNDRWLPMTPERAALRDPERRKALDALLKERMKNAASRGVIPQLPPHCDFRTPEYAAFDRISAKKWEATRGMSHSFGYNRRDTDADYESVESLVRSFIDAVAKNGNLLLNVGPRGEDAQIPDEQVARLKGFGAWLKANGDGVYGTRPWKRFDGKTACGIEVRFVQKPDALYVHVLGTPASNECVVIGDDLPVVAHATNLASGERIACSPTGDGVLLKWSKALAAGPAHAFKLNLS